MARIMMMTRNSMNSSVCTLDDVDIIDVGSNHSYDLSNDDNCDMNDDNDYDDDYGGNDQVNDEDKHSEKYLKKLLNKIDSIIFDHDNENGDNNNQSNDDHILNDLPIPLLNEIKIWKRKFRAKYQCNRQQFDQSKSIDSSMKAKALPKLSLRNNTTKRIDPTAFANNNDIEQQREFDIPSHMNNTNNDANKTMMTPLPPIFKSKPAKRCPTGYILLNETSDYIIRSRKASLIVNQHTCHNTTNLNNKLSNNNKTHKETTSYYFESMNHYQNHSNYNHEYYESIISTSQQQQQLHNMPTRLLSSIYLNKSRNNFDLSHNNSSSMRKLLVSNHKNNGDSRIRLPNIE